MSRDFGAAGYLPKSIDQDKLVAALKLAAENPDSFACDEGATPSRGVLSVREAEILTYISQGKTREEVSMILGIALETVKTHVQRIMNNLDANNTASAITRGFELGILKT